ncbi:MAG: ATP-binding protein [Chloroflexota bacterium]
MNGIWDEKHVKALLAMRRCPRTLIQSGPWQHWLAARGGVKAVCEGLREAALSPVQMELLELILAHPDASPVFYAGKLHVGQSAYFSRLSALIRALCQYLNGWVLAAPPLPPPNNLPASLTSLVGADETVDTIVTLIRHPDTRLLTLTGPGGVGKTRLALAAAAHLLDAFRDGIFFVPLETVTDPARFIPQVARLLNIETSRAGSLLDACKAYLCERQILLVLDNFEQLVEAGSLVTELLLAASQLKVVVTSREALHQYGERRFILHELPLPDPENPPPLHQLRTWPAVELFVQRVQALHPDFSLGEANQDAVLRICHQLDGLPLALELAAAQIKWLAPGQALPPLDIGLKTLGSPDYNRPPRQKTLWDTIHWSYQLLADAEKALFCRLAVFGREWSLDAARQVCRCTEAQAVLDALADKSLVRYVPQGDGSTRYQMLQAVREYALQQLDASEREAVSNRHAGYYIELTRRAEASIGGPDQPHWLGIVRQEHENLQLALQFLLDRHETEMAFTLLGALWRFWDMLNIWSETRLWMDRALAQGATLRSTGRAKTLWGASWLAAHQGDYARALALAQEGLALARENHDLALTARLLQSVAEGNYRFGNIEEGIALVEESLGILRQIGDQEEIAWALDHLARGQWFRGELGRSRQTLQESLAIFRRMGYLWAIAAVLRHAGLLALDDDDDEFALGVLTESLEISRQFGAKQRISEILRELAAVRWKQGRFEQAQQLFEDSLALAHEIGDRTGEGWALNWLGRLAIRRSDFALARQRFESAQRLFDQSGDPTAIAYNRDCFRQLI